MAAATAYERLRRVGAAQARFNLATMARAAGTYTPPMPGFMAALFAST